MQIIKNNLLLAPIALFCFNRSEHLEKTLNALKENSLAKDSILYIYSDGPRPNNTLDFKAVNQVRNLISKIDGFKKVNCIISNENKGLANSVIGGISQILKKHENVIVLEDDILVSKDFLQFMNECLIEYKKDDSIFSISGYSFKIDIVKNSPNLNLVKRASSWGWGTWRNVWEKVDWELNSYRNFIQDKNAQNKFMDAGKDQLPMLVKQQKGVINSWAIRWTYHHFKHHGYCLVPKYSKIKNIGTDGTGTNFNNSTDKYSTDLNESFTHLITAPKETPEVTHFIRNYYSPSLIRRAINYFRYGV